VLLNRPALSQRSIFLLVSDFFFETRQKLCLLLIKKRDIQLISGKSGENRYNRDQPHTPEEQGPSPHTTRKTNRFLIQTEEKTP
jgi:hypothetical protein